MDFTIKSITEYQLYRSKPETAYVSKYAYKLKLDLIKNIYEFLNIAADNKYTPFQVALRSYGIGISAASGKYASESRPGQNDSVLLGPDSSQIA